MEQQIKKIQEKDKQLPSEYFEFVKDSVENGAYFKDALNWYFLRYVNPLCDRTLMGFAAIISCIALYFLTQIISGIFPLIEEVPIVIRDHDSSTLRPMIIELKAQEINKEISADELVAKYLVTTYVKNRESYDYRNSDVSAVNNKFNYIKNNSSYGEYKNFQLFMSRENTTSPLNNFGRNIYSTVEISSIIFTKRQEKDYYNKLKSIFAQKIPSEAEIRFTNITHTFDADGTKKEQREDYLARIKFKFAGLDRNAKSGMLNFIINEYNLYKVK
ncbi:MAG TPA: VirB8/TrbF family protein [Rickettsiales bacterium]|nr:VirB8/TrbF family protein [Rickettsiales bacterium]